MTRTSYTYVNLTPVHRGSLRTRLSSAVWWTGSLSPFVLSSKVTGSCTGNRRPTKLSPVWIGPYQVLDQASNGMYRLQGPADLKQYLCHIDELYEYQYRMGLQMMWWMSSHSISSRQLFTQLSITALAVGKSKPQWVFRVRFVYRLRPERGCAAPLR